LKARSCWKQLAQGQRGQTMATRVLGVGTAVFVFFVFL
jgi:hypothetical protein